MFTQMYRLSHGTHISAVQTNVKIIQMSGAGLYKIAIILNLPVISLFRPALTLPENHSRYSYEIG